MVRRSPRDEEVDDSVSRPGFHLHRVMGCHVLLSRLQMDLHFVAIFRRNYRYGVRRDDCELCHRNTLLEKLRQGACAIPYVQFLIHRVQALTIY